MDEDEARRRLERYEVKRGYFFIFLGLVIGFVLSVWLLFR